MKTQFISLILSKDKQSNGIMTSVPIHIISYSWQYKKHICYVPVRHDLILIVYQLQLHPVVVLTAVGRNESCLYTTSFL